MLGKEGRPVQLITNHFPVEIKPVPCFQYDLNIKLFRRNANQFVEFKGPFSEKIQIIYQMIADWPEVFTSNGSVICHASDGAKNLFTKSKLDFEGTQSRELTLTLDGYPEQNFLVDIQFTKEVDLNLINDFYKKGSRVQLGTARVRDVQLQVYDIVSSHSQKEDHISVGRSLFPTERNNDNEIRDERENTVIVLGHFQSLVMTESGLTMNIDMSTTAFRTRSDEEPLEVFIKRELKINNLNAKTIADNIRDLSSRLNNLKISTNHIKKSGNRQKRSHKIERVVKETSDQKKITLDSGESVTLTQFFAQVHEEVLKHPDWPLVQIKGNDKFLPIELCQVYPNQPLPKNMIDPTIQAELTSASALKPRERFQNIQEERDKIVAEDGNHLMDNFGLTIGKNPILLEGRQLNEPKIRGTLNKLDKPAPNGLKKYVFFYLSRKYKNNLENNFKRFFHEKESLVQVANDMGLEMARDPINKDRLDLFSNADLNDPFMAFEK